MFFAYTILLLAGALPFIAFLVKRNRYRKILKEGMRTTAQVTQVRRIKMSKGPVYDQVFFAYLPPGAPQYYSGMFRAAAGKHRSGDILDIYYAADNPAKHAIPGSKGEKAVIAFLIIFFLFIVFACVKISDMV